MSAAGDPSAARLAEAIAAASGALARADDAPPGVGAGVDAGKDPVRDAAKRLLEAAAVFLDESAERDRRLRLEIAALREARDAVGAGERQSRSLFDHSIDGLLIADDSSRLVDANPAACAMLGRSREELLGKSVIEIAAPSMVSRTEELWRQFLDAGVQEGEFALRAGGGRTIDVEYNARAHFLPGRHLSMLHDVTRYKRISEALRQSEDALRISEQRYRFLTENAKDVIYQVQIVPERRIDYISPSVLALTGYPAEDWYTDAGLPVKVLDPRDVPAYREFRQVGGENRLQEFRITRRDGASIWVEDHIFPVFDESGRVVLYTGIIRDITEKKRAEAAHLSTRNQLERLREEWTSVVAHDLRQPVATISINAALLVRSAGSAAAKSRAEHILAGSERLNRMISDLLDVSRLDALRLDVERTAVRLPELVRALVERTAAEREDREVDVDVEEEIAEVDADPARVEQILGNLLSNATKYGRAATRIRVTLRDFDGEVRISVMNVGPGIGAEDMPRLFQRFQRGKARSGSISGVGLGLYISKKLVECHGGRLWVESTPDATTTFHFTLPTLLRPSERRGP